MITTWWEFTQALAWKSTILLAAAWAASLLLRRASAALRHLVWTLALSSLLLLPLFVSVLPGWLPATPHHAPVNLTRAIETSEGIVAHRNAPVWRPAPVLFSIWLSGAAVFLLRWRHGAMQVARLRKRATVVETSQLAGLIDVPAQVSVLRSCEEVVPLAAGILRPAVILPSSAFQWPPERLQVVLLHEMAHVRRRDSFTQALAELARCLYWFHPLVWLALHRQCAERERACDGRVLSHGMGASDYASHLLNLVRSLKMAAPDAVSMAGAHLETRIRAILNPQSNRRALSGISAAGACLAAACLVLPLAAMRPQAASPATVSGTVYDPAGARVPGATVIAFSSAAQELKATTDQEGNFTIGPLAAGAAWQVNVQAPGFASRVQRIDQAHLNISLDLGQVQENVTVHGKGTPASNAAPHRVRVGGNVVPARLVYKTDPEYPETLRSRGISGNVVLRAVISMKGTVLSLTPVSSPDPALTEAAAKAVNEWLYQPSLLNGEPVETATTITVNFELEP